MTLTVPLRPRLAILISSSFLIVNTMTFFHDLLVSCSGVEWAQSLGEGGGGQRGGASVCSFKF